MRVVHYFDYKSPYAYLAQEPTWRLAEETGAAIDFLPHTLDIPNFLGRAQVDGAGRVLVDERSPHNWRRVRYAYMDCRREAQRRGLIIRGPQKIFDSSIAHIGFLWAKRAGAPRSYHDTVFRLFWRRELQIEDPQVVRDLLERCGVDAGGFLEFLAGEGRREHDRIRAEAEQKGVFGVPSYLVDDELFWGGERIERVRERILAASA